MTASSNAPQPYEPASPEPAESPNETSAGRPSLDEVVRETLDAQGGTNQLAPELREAFAALARRHAAVQTLELSIAQELVDAVLICRFEQFRKQPELRAAAAHRIAQTLWNDSPSRARLDRLWNSLREDS